MADIEDLPLLVQDIIDLTARAINVVNETPTVPEPQAPVLQNLHGEFGRTIEYATNVQAPLEDMLSEAENEGQECASL